MGEIMTSVGVDDRADAAAPSAALPAGGWSPLLGEIALALEAGLRAAGAVPHVAMVSSSGLGQVPLWGVSRGREARPAAPAESRGAAIVPAANAPWGPR